MNVAGEAPSTQLLPGLWARVCQPSAARVLDRGLGSGDTSENG